MKILSSGKYYGDKKIEYKFNGIILSEYNYHKPRTPWHFHENPYFMYVLEGIMTDVNKHRHSKIPAGSLVFHNWQEVHMNEKVSKFGRGFQLELDLQWFETKKLDVDLWEGSKVLKNPLLHHLLGKIYYEFKIYDAYSEMAIELLLLQLCESIETGFLDEQIKKPPWIASLKDLLHHTTDNLSLKYLSEQLGVHPVHISRSIPNFLGCNLGEYLRRQKIKNALNKLLNDKHSLTEIAYSCGFSDQSHFTKTFKNYFGKTPKKFRRGLLTAH